MWVSFRYNSPVEVVLRSPVNRPKGVGAVVSAAYIVMRIAVSWEATIPLQRRSCCWRRIPRFVNGSLQLRQHYGAYTAKQHGTVSDGRCFATLGYDMNNGCALLPNNFQNWV